MVMERSQYDNNQKRSRSGGTSGSRRGCRRLGCAERTTRDDIRRGRLF